MADKKGGNVASAAISTGAVIVNSIVGGSSAATRRQTRISKDRATAEGRRHPQDLDYLRGLAASGGDLTRYEYDNKRRALVPGDDPSVNLFPVTGAGIGAASGAGLGAASGFLSPGGDGAGGGVPWILIGAGLVLVFLFARGRR